MHEHVDQGSRVRFDSTLALRADPYRFIGRQCALAGRDRFATRVLLKRTICMSGPAAAEVFYDPERFERAGAAPDLLRATLFGNRGVQTLDGPEHKLRKALFMTVLEPSSIDRLVAIVRRLWRETAEDWAGRDIELYAALQELLTRAVCRWACVPLGRTEVHERARQLTALFDQTDILDNHAFIQRLCHVIDCYECDGCSCYCFHFYPCLAAERTHGRHPDRTIFIREVDIDGVEEERVAHRDQISRLFGGHNAGDPGGTQYIAF